ncbi:MAG: mannose-1-phosphate guanylyltransferase/mannose-6-phosphate isomerase [Bdellovibrionia bacterium]
MIPAIICGGQGTRLWPLSRASYPKPFCSILEKSLFEKTLERLESFGSPWVVTAENLRGLVFQSLRERRARENVLFEPMPKNTAPAIALLCRVFELKGRAKDVIGIFPADHLVEKTANFYGALKLAESCALKGRICTIGVKPSYPATGYGYIEVQEQVFESAGEFRSYNVNGFREKPDVKTAEEFLNKGNFYWNAGIFVFQVGFMIDCFKKHMPGMWDAFQPLKEDLSNLKTVYAGIESKSIDYGIMEKVREQVCVPADLGWSDVGSWDEVAKLEGAARSENVVATGGENFVVTGRAGKVVGLVDVDGLLVVDTEDALLISKKGSSQKVGALLKDVEKKSPVTAKEHLFDFRPWGKYETLREESGFKVKVIRVDPGQQFSYQSHNQRAEHWVLVKGRATVILNEKPHELGAGDYIFIPKGAKHRMRNDGNIAAEFVEVQIGAYLGEDDIIRYDDDYGRGSKT